MDKVLKVEAKGEEAVVNEEAECEGEEVHTGKERKRKGRQSGSEQRTQTNNTMSLLHEYTMAWPTAGLDCGIPSCD